MVFKVIEVLSKNGAALGFKTCVLKENQGEINDIQKFAHSLGALHRLDDMLSRRLDGSAEPYKYRGKLATDAQTSTDCGSDIYRPFPLRSSSFGGQAPIAHHSSSSISLFNCGVGRTQAVITPQGEFKPCLVIDSPRYSILSSSLEDAWQKLKIFISRIKPQANYKCNDCQLQTYCKWCPAKGWLYNKNFSSCDKESYMKAEFIKQIYEGKYES